MRQHIIPLLSLLFAFSAFHHQAQAQSSITIGGKVYGGGKQGAILSGNTTSDNSTAAESVAITDIDFQHSASAQASQVTINSGTIVGVFGGGQEGRCYGKANVTVTDGTIGVTDPEVIAGLSDHSKMVNGNIFGAGDGNAAIVFGGSNVTIVGGNINGNVYGGGNEANLIGSTAIDLQGGDYAGAVFGGARKADIYGYTYVNIDGLNAKNDLHIADVYGGNDIAGQIHPSETWEWTKQAVLHVPFALADAVKAPNLTTVPADHVDNTWNAFILATNPASSSVPEVQTKKIFVDNLYAGGNGDYDYSAPAYTGLSKPLIDRTYLQLEGGAYGNVYGGGNAATVAVSTDICLLNGTDMEGQGYAEYIAPSPTDPDDPSSAPDSELGASASLYSAEYQFNRVFGGNNKEPMAIRPNWYLEQGTINNLYSGGNAGAMTYFAQTSTGGASSLAGNAGILIHIKSDDMTVNNVYGGCRMADVDPNGHKGADMVLNPETIDGFAFERGYAARVLIEGGNINNVYGGNDVSGNVYYGSQVEIHSSINGDVYGAGNGSYAYTDQESWVAAHPEDADFYYDPSAAASSVEALNNWRPNVEKSWVHIVGHDVGTPTVIGGSLYCGGNSATLRTTSGDLASAKAHLQIGSYVIADQVFQGSNGVNMISTEMLQKYADPAFSSLDLTDAPTFGKYMEGVEVMIRPDVAFDPDYADHTARFGSLYCGGNVGSMSADGEFTINFLNSLVIYNKLVGGSNSANVEKSPYNAFHLGGLTGAPNSDGNKVNLNIAGLKLEPRVLKGNVQSGFTLNEWNYEDPDATLKMLKGANIYGGCYASGYINGGVKINISENSISDMVTSSGVPYETIQNDVLASTLSVYGGGYGKETEIWGNTSINITGNGQIMKAYGGGEMGVVGKLKRDADGHYETENVKEWYSETNIEELHGYDTPVTKYLSRDHSVAKFTDDGIFNTSVTLNATLPGGGNLNVAKLYGGGFQGTVSGSTTVNLNRGRVYDAFGGASNADILGHTEMYIGKASAPQVTNNVYGANDFGGLIVGHNTFYVDNNKDGDNSDTMEKIVAQTYVEYTAGNIAGNVFGGPCGAYEYKDGGRLQMATNLYTYAEYTALPGNESVTEDAYNALKDGAIAKPGSNFCKPQLLEDLLTPGMLTPLSGAGYAANSFVNVISPSTQASDIISGSIFGAGQGMKGHINAADERGSYVRLMSASKSQRTVGELSQRVYGAGYCSNTNRSLIDAYTGYYRTLFGGAHGITYEEVLHLLDENGRYETNYMGFRSAVRLHEMANNQMDIYGGGANAGSQEAGVVLIGGEAHNVYGASFDQGITYAASVEVPSNSTSKVNAIFGGAKGKSDEFPCDVYNTFVSWNGPNARVSDAIYGGNDAFRMTRNAYIAINQPVRNFEDKLTNVFGGGFGENTVTLYTSVGLQEGAEVANVYGGGNNGQVLDTPSFRYYLDDGTKACVDGTTKTENLKTYPEELFGTGYGYEKYLNDSEVIGFHDWIVSKQWDGVTLDSRDQPLGSYTSNAHGHAHDLYFLSTQMADMKNTNVFILRGATVAENAYGGGYGSKALVSGETSVKLWGGSVKGDIYGGGYGGDVAEYEHLIYPAGGEHEMTRSATYVNLQGGSARNVYGGGLNGHVVGTTNITLGAQDEHQFDFYGTHISGQYEHQVYYGDPVVERSLYGGGQNGHVYGTSYLNINQGHVGYKYDPTVTIETTLDDDLRDEYNNSHTTPERKAEILQQICYVENLDLNDADDNLLDQNGNVFGAGYGEGASVDVTYVNIYGGTIRNSLYGGGEIAAVGRGTMRTDSGSNKELQSIDVAGRTHIYMYNGLVQGDVFGGGRGYSYDLTGNEIIGKTLYTDGYVFGTTEVEIRGGTVGTPKTVEDGHGNVFGGGNIGYCFTDAAKHGTRGDGTGEGRYYTNAWQCTADGCGFIDYCHNAPTVCGKCGKSPTATDPLFRTSFTKVLADGSAAGGANEYILSEDCRVVVSPYAQVKPGTSITIVGNGETLPDGTVLDTKTFQAGEYVPTYYLDLLKDKNTDKSQWDLLKNDGVTIRNAVFAGGNVSSGSDKVYANAITVFGNATASINDIFFRDLITIGTEHTGGIYGDGNLTFVDGYRELNITDYGTDYYSQQDHISLEDYNNMNDRERAYFELEYQTSETHHYIYYTCNTSYAGHDRGDHLPAADYASLDPADKSKWDGPVDHTYNTGDKIKQSEWALMDATEQAHWEMFGFCSIYAGRLLNTIQRADFCGVFGSRLVLEGAQDRVPEVVDYTQYTINRVAELSLNASHFKGNDPSVAPHGNYFGMYNIVNYLGALTSDVAFDDVRETDNSNGGYKDAVDTPSGTKDYGTASFYDWKLAHKGDRKRNNGMCHNTVALAAGVYLELVEEPATSIVTPDTPKDYGYITGIVQLDLINVMPGLGGGYVYAKNEHGKRSGNPAEHENLSIYNKGAVNNSKYTYDESDRELIETSGNFIHNMKQIVDDCYPAGGRYYDYNAAPAHYWYIRGEVYVYDQYLSAYTGSSTAYQENINLPLTITAGSNGRLDLIDIKQNFYAYYKEGSTPLDTNEAIVVNNITYGLNDIITWWEYMQLSDDQKAHFVTETYVATRDYATSDNGTRIEKGAVILPSEYASIKNNVAWDPDDIYEEVPGEPHMRQITMGDVFHVSNAVSHDNGYILAVKLDNPIDWDNWYSPQSGPQKINQLEYKKKSDSDKLNYNVGPTYYTNEPGVYGQHEFILDDIIAEHIRLAYNSIPPSDITALEAAGKEQAVVQPAYVAITAADYEYNDGVNPPINKNVQAGVGISADEYSQLNEENKAKFSPAYTCTSTFEEDASSGLYVYFGELIPATRYQDFYNKLVDDYKAEHAGEPGLDALANSYAQQQMNDHFDKANIVTKAGYYGGQHFASDFNYRALDTWATLSKEDRAKFKFRYDALDALLLASYPGTGEEGPGANNINLYDGDYWNGANSWPEHPAYGAKQPINYQAKYEGPSPLNWTDKDGNSHTLTNADEPLEREDYEALPNERRHYSPFIVTADNIGNQLYLVKSSFIYGGTNYNAGSIITESAFNSLSSDRQNQVEVFTPSAAGTYYICRENYTVNEKGMGQSVTDQRPAGTTYAANDEVPTGVIINADTYSTLVNKQLEHFTIHGNSPIETSTFYVNRESDIYDLSKDRVVTVIYQYKYEESDELGQNVEEITERHIINIHITFKSGVPTIGKLQDPSIVLPGQTVGLKLPNVTPGAYEILGGGWEIFTNPEDAQKHTNGKTYINNATPMYWYQDGYFVAYYAKTYLGKTYSNSVPFKVANYHDIADVMAHPDYMFIDNPNVKRNSKIYISDDVHDVVVTPAIDDTPAVTREESEIDMLYDLFNTSLESSEKTIYVDVQDVDGISGLPLYYEVDGNGNKTSETTTDITAYPVTHKEPRNVPKFDNHARNCANLAFFLSEDVSTAKAGGWEPIGSYDDEHPENGQCFMGNLHGMGYTINGLQQSLFENLCGYVYNLGVTGDFTKSGVADRVQTAVLPDSDGRKVHGHVNSSWIYTSADPLYVASGSFNSGGDPYYPVVGVPNDLDAGFQSGSYNALDALSGLHTLNCYYPEECGYPIGMLPHAPNTTANSASLYEFNNGTVAYDLNGFYLNKRYSDAVLTASDVTSGTTPDTGDNVIYQYWKQTSDGTLEDSPTTSYYVGGGSMHAYDGRNLGYVERIFADGDFVYRNGTIPLETNERYSTTESRYLPIWPDDYIYFGQQLTYGYDEGQRPYQPLPAHARKTATTDGAGKDYRLLTTQKNNIIFRVPAYYRNSEKATIHFNPYAIFADHIKDTYSLSAEDLARGLDAKVLNPLDEGKIHSGLTAIDFSGFNDRAIMVNAGTDHQKFQSVPNKLAFSNGSRYITSKPGYEDKYAPINDGIYFGPITDYTVLMSIETHGITQNLLAYAPTAAWSAGTANTQSVLHDYFNEPEYHDYYSADKYRKVAVLSDTKISGVHGHLIMKENTTPDRHYYYAGTDHLLVDKQDFNAPIEYEFNRTKKDAHNNTFHMWYQRTPDNYADTNRGWEGVSIPFSAELVTTQDKGEITHFYNSALGAAYTAGKTSGHEYWLREFTGVSSNAPEEPEVITANMNYPVETPLSTAKSGLNAVTNTFLWDYYYNYDQKDANGDDYRHDTNGDSQAEQDLSRYYYGQQREYDNYPLAQAGTPYIVGFPGGRYYEFDLSGDFAVDLAHSGPVTVPDQLEAQTITFVSSDNFTIRVSDEELAADGPGTVTPDGSAYTFYGNYLNIEAPAASSMDTDYLSAAEYNAAKGTTLTDDEFAALPAADKFRETLAFNYYLLNADGSAFELATAVKTPIAPFRPYFATMLASPLKAPAVRSITFGMGGYTQLEPDEDTLNDAASHGLNIYAKRGKIIVESTLEVPQTVRITTAAGQLITTFTIEPGERIATPVQDGIYITNLKKILVD